MKSCTCKNCGHVYVSKRTRAFCSNSCRAVFMANNPLPAFLIGATTDDNKHHSNR
jgi:endogenous inhibitor of DNA gyrase (YacG/DUF329 family)